LTYDSRPPAARPPANDREPPPPLAPSVQSPASSALRLPAVTDSAADCFALLVLSPLAQILAHALAFASDSPHLQLLGIDPADLAFAATDSAVDAQTSDLPASAASAFPSRRPRSIGLLAFRAVMFEHGLLWATIMLGVTLIKAALLADTRAAQGKGRARIQVGVSRLFESLTLLLLLLLLSSLFDARSLVVTSPAKRHLSSTLRTRRSRRSSHAASAPRRRCCSTGASRHS
jgi:hypothetical protein